MTETARPDVTALVVPAELVEDLREGTYEVLRRVADAVAEAIGTEAHSMHPHHQQYRRYRARASAACALLDDIGWSSTGFPSTLRVDLPSHGVVLLSALLGALGDAEHALKDVTEGRQKDQSKRQASIQRVRALSEFTALAFMQAAAIGLAELMGARLEDLTRRRGAL